MNSVGVGSGGQYGEIWLQMGGGFLLGHVLSPTRSGLHLIPGRTLPWNLEGRRSSGSFRTVAGTHQRMHEVLRCVVPEFRTVPGTCPNDLGYSM